MTDPTLAQLVAQYRAWVKVENKRLRDEETERYKRDLLRYGEPSWLDEKLGYRARPWGQGLNYHQLEPTGAGFLDWLVNEAFKDRD